MFQPYFLLFFDFLGLQLGEKFRPPQPQMQEPPEKAATLNSFMGYIAVNSEKVPSSSSVSVTVEHVIMPLSLYIVLVSTIFRFSISAASFQTFSHRILPSLRCPPFDLLRLGTAGGDRCLLIGRESGHGHL